MITRYVENPYSLASFRVCILLLRRHSYALQYIGISSRVAVSVCGHFDLWPLRFVAVSVVVVSVSLWPLWHVTGPFVVWLWWIVICLSGINPWRSKKFPMFIMECACLHNSLPFAHPCHAPSERKCIYKKMGHINPLGFLPHLAYRNSIWFLCVL